MKKYIKLSLMALVLGMSLASCDNDDPNGTSIFGTTEKTETEFDKWLNANFTVPYNIQLNYLYNDKLSNNNYNVVPATITNSKAMAKMIKHVWLDAYVEAVGEDFVKENTFRVFQFIGSPEYNSQGSIVLGTAEGGIQVTLFRINELDLNNIFVNMNEPFRPHHTLPLDLNYWYFHTMHHEFCHILTQKKYYSTDFQTISAGKYHSADWINVEDEDAVKEGFVTGYASGEYNEDFAEVYANYVTSSDASWAARMREAGTDGAAIINAKLEIVRSYFNDTWGIDLDNLRAIVLRRSAEVQNMDLTTLN
ncbi:MAG: putative zinc-binding metallopeptidase [Prevotella sp.]|nr:putative zinc-binding metallopeptidase [Prevotella sp.]